jgi:hypothetical protein
LAFLLAKNTNKRFPYLTSSLSFLPFTALPFRIPLQTYVKIPMSHFPWAKIPLGKDSTGNHPLGLLAPIPMLAWIQQGLNRWNGTSVKSEVVLDTEKFAIIGLQTMDFAIIRLQT